MLTIYSISGLRTQLPIIYLHLSPPPSKFTLIHGEEEGRRGGGGGRGGGIIVTRNQISHFANLLPRKGREKEEEKEEKKTVGEMEVLREVLKEALHLVSSRTYTCRKLVTMGGYSCNYKTDGKK